MFIGGYVSASGVGLTCPEWPLCPQGIIPDGSFLIEYFHRSVAATAALLVIATMAFTIKSKVAPRGMKIASIIAAGAVIGQVTLGGIVIVQRLQSLLVTGHLGLGIMLFSMMLMTVIYAFKIDYSKNAKASTLPQKLKHNEDIRER